MNNKPLCIVSCPPETYSGYGARSRDFLKALFETKGDEWDIKVLSQRWGNTRWGFIEDHLEEWGFLQPHLLYGTELPKQPQVWIQITVPNEFQAIGEYNIGLTAGIETTKCAHQWLEGMNRMDLNLVSSKFSKESFENTQYEGTDQNGQKVLLKLEKPIEVLTEGINLDKYKKLTSSEVSIDLSGVEESFAYLFVGHWLQGEFAQDRKNVSYMIKAFLETFKNKRKQPALILKTSRVSNSVIDKSQVLTQIDSIRQSVNGTLPNIYLLHGDFTDAEMNELYNHSKVKSMISFTKGEGFGRPLAEFTQTKKPIIASGWSGHTDFLKPNLSVLLGGALNNVHPTAQVQDMILADSQWFQPHDADVGNALRGVFEKYKDYTIGAKSQGTYVKNHFSHSVMRGQLDKYLDLAKFTKQVSLQLPKLDLPKLKKLL